MAKVAGFSILMICLIGCGDGDAFDPATVDLVGHWTFNSTTNEPTTVCHVINLPVDIQVPYSNGTQVGLIGAGGMIQCTTNGQVSPARPYLEGSEFVIIRGGEEVWLRLGADLFYQGRIESADRMRGSVTIDSLPGSWVGMRD